MESETHIAVNICLLPDPISSEWAFRTSELAASGTGESPLLQRGITVPHVTLWMGLMETAQLREAEQAIMPLFFPFSVEPGALYAVHPETSKVAVWSLGFEPNPTLVQLHAIIMELMEKFEIREEPVSAHFAGGASERTRSYVQGFRSLHAGRHYTPHITLGYAAALRSKAAPGSTGMEQMAIFRMGEGCTCRRRISNASQSGFPA